jgi:hypothetical protein
MPAASACAVSSPAAASEWHLQAATHNLRKLHRGVCPPRQISHSAAPRWPQDRAANRLKHAKGGYPQW